VTTRSKRLLFAGCGLLAGLLALAVAGVVVWLASATVPADKLARVKALPVYPGASNVQAQMEQTPDGQTGVLSFDTPASMDDMFAFYDPALRSAGWQKVVGESDGGTGLYTEPEGSFEGIEFTGGSASSDTGFPWFRLDRNRTPLWLHIDVSQLDHNGSPWTRVAVELTQP
jgi:hypothetical protein